MFWFRRTYGCTVYVECLILFIYYYNILCINNNNYNKYKYNNKNTQFIYIYIVKHVMYNKEITKKNISHDPC